MTRCLTTAVAALAVALPLLACAQADRAIPVPIKSLRGEVAFGQPPEVLLNGQPARLSPGSRIKGTDNMLIMSGQLVGQKLIVNYTIDPYGLLQDIWLLRKEEIDKPWPRTPQESAAWSYGPIQHVWIKP